MARVGRAHGWAKYQAATRLDTSERCDDGPKGEARNGLSNPGSAFMDKIEVGGSRGGSGTLKSGGYGWARTTDLGIMSATL